MRRCSDPVVRVWANAVRRARRERRLTQVECCAVVGCSQSRWSLIEAGAIEPRPEEKRAIAELFGSDPNVMFRIYSEAELDELAS